MAHNPYAPPTAPVADVPKDPMGKNQEVWIACTLLWISLGISMTSLTFRLLSASRADFDLVKTIATLIGGAVALLTTCWYISKLKAGRNWMRLLLTILTTFRYISMAVFWDYYRANVFPTDSNGPAMAAQAVLQAILGICAVVLLNTPGARAWFAASKRNARN